MYHEHLPFDNRASSCILVILFILPGVSLICIPSESLLVGREVKFTEYYSKENSSRLFSPIGHNLINIGFSFVCDFIEDYSQVITYFTTKAVDKVWNVKVLESVEFVLCLITVSVIDPEIVKFWYDSFSIYLGEFNTSGPDNGEKIIFSKQENLFQSNEVTKRLPSAAKDFCQNMGFGVIKKICVFLAVVVVFRLFFVRSQYGVGCSFRTSTSTRDQFSLNESSSSVLNRYTESTCFHRDLNLMLRQQRDDLIYQHRDQIFELIESLRQPIPSEDDSVLLTLYRGQQMTIMEVDELRTHEGEIVSSLPFLSTSLNSEIATIFAGDGRSNNMYFVSVIFTIFLDTGQPTKPYALIDGSAEEEVLLSPRTKFLLVSCRKLHDNGRLWHFELRAIPEKQQKEIECTYGRTFLTSNKTTSMDKNPVVVVRKIIT